ncbi:hypothetical protein HYU21_02385 [Candidatus Woesearchaeota archaeon]|nr:hypothetical protein [Candidatus Woesearchaeota archaeon]
MIAILLILGYRIVKDLWYIIKHKKSNTKIILLIILIISLLFVYQKQSLVMERTSNFIDSIKFNELIPFKIDFDNLVTSNPIITCPQLSFLSSIPLSEPEPSLMLQPTDIVSFFSIKEVETLFGYSINTYVLNGMACRKGSEQGENKQYYYCGSLEAPAPYMVYNVLDNDSNIKEIIKKTFINVYDSKGMFVKTICGRSPDSITNEIKDRRTAEDQKAEKEMKEFFGMFN